MSILCAIFGLFQLVMLIALTGVLLSVAAVSRLMEVTIALLYSLTIFMFRQSSKLVISVVNELARLTIRTFSGMCRRNCSEEVVINLHTPEVQYVVNVVPDFSMETEPTAENIEEEETVDENAGTS